jgi:hypothetical protein
VETLIIFIIFIVFSAIRSLGGQGQRPPGRPMPPVMHPGRTPVRPPQQQIPKQKEVTLPRYVEQAYEPYDNPIYRSKTELPVELRPATRERLPKQAETKAILPEGLICAEAGQVQTLTWNHNSVVAGVIFAEILGPPRAKRPWSPRQ